jgi:hypothetical protein
MQSNSAELARSAERSRRTALAEPARPASVSIRTERRPHFRFARLRVAGRG